MSRWQQLCMRSHPWCQNDVQNTRFCRAVHDIVCPAPTPGDRKTPEMAYTRREAAELRTPAESIPDNQRVCSCFWNDHRDLCVQTALMRAGALPELTGTFRPGNTAAALIQLSPPQDCTGAECSSIMQKSAFKFESNRNN
jgi:hypothetical protein